MATIKRAVAAGMVLGPRAGLDLLATIDTDTRIANHHLLYAVRGHLLEMAGHTEEAAFSFESAARRTARIPEKRYRTARALGLVRLGSVDLCLSRGWRALQTASPFQGEGCGTLKRTSVVHVVQKSVVRAPRKTHTALTTTVRSGQQR
jgi:hypothetical protein